MDMVTVAIELFDKQPILYQTRATYLMQQEQWEDAVKDLLYTVSQMPNLVTARKKLIDCYDNLGQTSEADAQRDALDSILVQLDDEQRKLVEEVLKR